MKTLLVQHDMQKQLNQVERYLEEFLQFEHEFLKESSTYILRSGGKRMRPTIVLLTAAYFDNDENAIPLAAVMELIHMSSLIHDDVVDEAQLRRGKATLNILHSPQHALHIGDYVLTKALTSVHNGPYGDEIVKILANLDIEMCNGEIQQLLNMYNTKQTLEDYYYCINRKTALLMAVCCQCGALISAADKETVQKFYDIGHNMGMAFQIKDDILDMAMDEKKLGKPAGSDLARGILTLPTLLVLEKEFPEKARMLTLIENRFKNGREEIDWCLDIIKKYKGIEEAETYCNDYIKKAQQLLDELPDHPTKKAFVKGMQTIVKRDY